MTATPTTFAELVDDAAKAKGLNDYQLSAAIGLMPGNRVCSPKQVDRIRKGQQVHYNRDLVQRLIDVLELDPYRAWELAGLWPPGLTGEHLRELGLFGTSRRNRRADRALEVVSTEPAAVLGTSDGRTGDCPSRNIGIAQAGRAAA